MLISDLQQSLREIALRRISSGVTNQIFLARATGFKQAHISNFLHGNRNLSIKGFDSMLAALALSASDLMTSNKTPVAARREYDEIPIVSAEVAHYPEFAEHHVLDTVRFKRSFLRTLRPCVSGPREIWTRFITVEANALNAAAMHPRISKGALLLVDRHFNSLRSYRVGEPNIYVVKTEKSVVVRCAELHHGHLLLRPLSSRVPLEIRDIGTSATNEIIGRVCHIGGEV